MKKILVFLMVALMSIGMANALTSIPSGASCATMQSTIAANCADDIELLGDIDCSSDTWTSGLCSGYGNTFDGNGYKISGLTINCASGDCGFFSGTIGATIQDIGFENFAVNGGGGQTGIVAGSLGTGSSALRVWATGTIDCNSGAFCGTFGGRSRGNHYDNYADVDITDAGSYSGVYAGLTSHGTKSRIYAIGSITGGDYLGGLSGWMENNFVDSFSAAAVSGTGSNVGGVIGNQQSGSLTNVKWDTTTSGQADCTGGGTPAGCTGESNPLYFQGAVMGNAPMSSWDWSTPIWYEYTSPIDYPRLYPQSGGGSGEEAIPEFSSIGALLAIVLIFTGTVYVLRKHG